MAEKKKYLSMQEFLHLGQRRRDVLGCHALQQNLSVPCRESQVAEEELKRDKTNYSCNVLQKQISPTTNR